MFCLKPDGKSPNAWIPPSEFKIPIELNCYVYALQSAFSFQHGDTQCNYIKFKLVTLLDWVAKYSQACERCSFITHFNWFCYMLDAGFTSSSFYFYDDIQIKIHSIINSWHRLVPSVLHLCIFIGNTCL